MHPPYDRGERHGLGEEVVSSESSAGDEVDHSPFETPTAPHCTPPQPYKVPAESFLLATGFDTCRIAVLFRQYGRLAEGHPPFPPLASRIESPMQRPFRATVTCAPSHWAPRPCLVRAFIYLDIEQSRVCRHTIMQS